MPLFITAKLGVALILLGVGGWGLWEESGDIFQWVIQPGGPFEEYEPPPAPDYAQIENWAALPDKEDNADVVPPDSGASDQQATAEADTFFLHPTTYFGWSNWNGPTDSWSTQIVTSQGILKQQASAFNGSTRVYAPRYRQLSMGGYYKHVGADQGKALAYSDVKRAFEYYLEHWNKGRPIILAGHSQGSDHAHKLLHEFFDHKPLRQQLVAAYIMGMGIVDKQYVSGESSIPRCSTPQQVGCMISWLSFAEGGSTSKFFQRAPDEQFVCTNPLSWSIDEIKVPKTANLGAIPLINVVGLNAINPQLVGARCEKGYLWIDEPEVSGYSVALFEGKNYHAYDYNLFYMNIRQNVAERVKTFLQKPAGASE